MSSINPIKIITLLSLFGTLTLYGSLSNEHTQFQKKLEKIIHESDNFSAVAVVQNSRHFTITSEHANENTQFYIGSLTKNMTAYMLLVSLHTQYPEADLEDLLNKKLDALFPDSPLLKAIDKDWITQVSLLDLLTHQSGLEDYLTTYYDGRLITQETLNKPLDVTAFLKSVAFDPEKKVLYSNSNYLLIAKLIEEINNDSFDHVFEKIIKIPAKMHASSAPVTGNYFDLRESLCCTHLAPDLNENNFADMANALGAGNVISTKNDLVKWGRFLFKKAPKNITDIMLKNYNTNQEEDAINLGLRTEHTAQLGDLIKHKGSIDSFNSFLGYAPQDNILIIFLSNNKLDADRLINALNDWLSKPKEAKEEI